MLEIIALVAALVLCVWTPIETRKVRNGWVRKKFKGTPAEFVTAYRRQLHVFTWVGGVLGLGNITLAAILDAGDPRQIVKIVAGGIWLVAAAISFYSRRQLDVPAV
jgi:hypothetical protein